MLSPEQKQVLGINEDAVILAGAGSGKTTTLVACVTQDIIEGIPSDEIAVCTFTRVAASTLRSRIDAELLARGRVPDDDLWIGTIDSLVRRLLQGTMNTGDERDLFSLKVKAFQASFDDLSSEDQITIQKNYKIQNSYFRNNFFNAAERMRELDLSSPREFISPIPDASEAREALQELIDSLTSEAQIEAVRKDLYLLDFDPTMMSKRSWGIRKKDLADIRDSAAEKREQFRRAFIDSMGEALRDAISRWLSSYVERYLSSMSAISIGDYLEASKRALQLSRPIWQKVYLDEAQDTSPLQMELIRSMLSGPLIAIGDLNQSIYSFRGADPKILGKMTEKSKIFTLRDNYRSTSNIIEATETMLSHLPVLSPGWISQKEKRPRPERKGDPVTALLYSLPGSHLPKVQVEAEAAVVDIVDLAQSRGHSLSDIVVLARSNNDVPTYVQAFRRAGIPALAMQNRGLLDQEEARDVLAYIDFLLHEDEESLLRVMSSPFLGIEDEALLDFAKKSEKGSWFESLSLLYPDFCRAVEEVKSRLGQMPIADLLRLAIEKHNFDVVLQLIDQTGSRWRNIEKVLWLISTFEAKVGQDLGLVRGLLADEEEAPVEGQNTSLPRGLNAIRVMTIHQAKGEEFPCVVVARLSRRSGNRGPSLALLADGSLGVSVSSGSRSFRDSSLQLYCDQDKKSSLQDEERLLYVACTRAEETLILVGAGRRSNGESVWGAPLSLMIPHVPELGEESGEKIKIIHKELIKTKAREPKANTYLEIDDIYSVLQIPESSLPPLSYTSLSRWRACGLRRFLEGNLRLSYIGEDDSEGEGSRLFGQKMHQALASVDWANPDFDTNPFFVSDEKSKTQIKNLSKAPLFKELISPKTKTESAFSYALGPYLLRGRIDVSLYGKESLVVDWKSGAEDIFEKDYSLQRKIYALALLKLGSLKARATTFELMTGKIIEEIFEDENNLENQIIEEIEGILKAPALPATLEPKPFCHSCPGLQKGCPVSLQEG